MDIVCSQVMIAGGNEDFIAGQRIGPVRIFDGQLAGFADDQVKSLFVEILIFGMAAELFDFKLFIENKVDIPAVGRHLGHNSPSFIRIGS
jgi:hypothetical protein